MYDIPEVRAALAALWNGIAKRLAEQGLREFPDGLVHDRPIHDLWADPDLLLSQCCGFDLIYRGAGRLRYLATPRYTAPGCDGCHYASAVVVADRCGAVTLEGLHGLVCVINGPESHSGMNALRALVARHSQNGRFFAQVKTSWAHVTSLQMMRKGEAEVTAIDCVTYAILSRHRPELLAGTRLLCFTELAPGIPFVTRADLDEGQFTCLRRAITGALGDPGLRWACDELMIDGAEILPTAAYEKIVELERLAVDHGYPDLN